MTRVFALTTRGLEAVSAEEIAALPGVTVERVTYRRVAATCAGSLEPLLGPMPALNLVNIDWVIVGGESGPGARPMAAEWARDLRNQCLDNGVPFFFKQWGGVNKKKAGRSLDGRTWDQMPAIHTAVPRVA